MKYNRYRFLVQFPDDCDYPDCRPIKWPLGGLPGPYWLSAQGENNSYFLVMCVPVELDAPSVIKEYWPEATKLDLMNANCDLLFTSRFPKPTWWTKDNGI